MAVTREEALRLLNAPERLDNLKKLIAENEKPVQGNDVNNHIHTTYSFSPYSPTRPSGLRERRGCAPAA